MTDDRLHLQAADPEEQQRHVEQLFAPAVPIAATATLRLADTTLPVVVLDCAARSDLRALTRACDAGTELRARSTFTTVIDPPALFWEMTVEAPIRCGLTLALPLRSFEPWVRLVAESGRLALFTAPADPTAPLRGALLLYADTTGLTRHLAAIPGGVR